jgi:hypothetical protein
MTVRKIMYVQQARIAADKAEKYLHMLAKHFARKVTVEYPDDKAIIYFPMGTCIMLLDDQQRLEFTCQAKEQDALKAVMAIINDHIPLLKAIKDETLNWYAISPTLSHEEPHQAPQQDPLND